MDARSFITLCIIKTFIFFDEVVYITSSTEVTSAVGVTFGSDGCDFIDVKCEEYNTSTDKNETENNYTVATTAVSMLLNISNENEIENNYAVVTTAIPLLLNISKETSSTTLRNEICTCDLQISICDINCCCDEDCTNEKRLVFDHCEMEPSPIYDTRYCKHLTLSYKNNTPYEWQVNYNNLFCIVKNNLPDEYSSHKEVEIFSDNDANFRKVNKHRWNSIHPMKKLLYTGNKSYFRYGDFVWIVQNRRLKVLEIPKNFEGTGVVITKKAKYLQNIKTTCIQTNLFAHNKLLDISTFIVNVTVVALPNSINIHRLEECPSNICIPVQARVCDDALEHCRNITKPFNTSIYRADCNFKGNRSNYSCHNIVKKLRYIIFHNATAGIVKVEILFFINNLGFDNLKTAYILQEFEIKHVWFNVSTEYSLLRSGNPGYIIGKPIMVGQIAKHTNTGKNIITRNSLDVTTNFLVVSRRKSGGCLLNNNTNTIIKFGYNMIFTCKMIDFLDVTNETAKKNCEKIQKAIFKLWSIQDSSQNITKVYAKYGNANIYKIDDWGNITYIVEPKTLLFNITGTFSSNNSKISCQHLYNIIKIDIFHARQVVKNLHNQEKIVWLMISFENKHNQSFLISDNRVSLNLHLKSEIMFYDVTAKKNTQYVTPPAFDIKLPYDFFYPFVKIKNESNKVIDSYLLWVSISFEILKILINV